MFLISYFQMLTLFDFRYPNIELQYDVLDKEDLHSGSGVNIEVILIPNTLNLEKNYYYKLFSIQEELFIASFYRQLSRISKLKKCFYFYIRRKLSVFRCYG